MSCFLFFLVFFLPILVFFYFWSYCISLIKSTTVFGINKYSFEQILASFVDNFLSYLIFQSYSLLRIIFLCLWIIPSMNFYILIFKTIIFCYSIITLSFKIIFGILFIISYFFICSRRFTWTVESLKKLWYMAFSPDIKCTALRKNVELWYKIETIIKIKMLIAAVH